MLFQQRLQLRFHLLHGGAGFLRLFRLIFAFFAHLFDLILQQFQLRRGLLQFAALRFQRIFQLHVPLLQRPNFVLIFLFCLGKRG